MKFTRLIYDWWLEIDGMVLILPMNEIITMYYHGVLWLWAMGYGGMSLRVIRIKRYPQMVLSFDEIRGCR
jgi:hypothetical protein